METHFNLLLFFQQNNACLITSQNYMVLQIYCGKITVTHDDLLLLYFNEDFNLKQRMSRKHK